MTTDQTMIQAIQALGDAAQRFTALGAEWDQACQNRITMARAALDAGLSRAQVAALLGVSRQRVYELLPPETHDVRAYAPSEREAVNA